jgi:uncharacterized protein
MREEILLWRRLDEPGHENARLVYHEPFWQLGGMAVFASEGKACRLEYSIACDAGWRTLHVDVAGWVGPRRIRFHLVANAERAWHLDGRPCPEVAGCLDVDLSFSPATNLLPIRRLALQAGQSAAVRAAWVSFPGFTIEPLDQLYRRVGETSYHYEAAGGTFATDFEVNAAGFVTRYSGRWEEEMIPAVRR